MRTHFHVYLGSIVLTIITLSAFIPNALSRDSGETGLELTATTIPSVSYSAGHAPIDLVFKNRTDKPIRLLDVFDDMKIRKIFFTVELTRADGTPIQTLGGGKVSPRAESLKYRVLEKNGKLAIRIGLNEFLPDDSSLKAGAYNLIVRYSNQYGDDCFKGSLKSNSISIYIGE